MDESVVTRSGAEAAAGIAWLPLFIAIALTLALTIYPQFATDAAGNADHGVALAAMLAISAGFVRGVGFIPRHRLARWLFSTATCLLGVGLAALQLLLDR